MTRESIVFFLGIVVFILPHLGIPETWKMYAYGFSGVVLMIVGYWLRQRAYIRSIQKANGERDADSFVESNGSSSKKDSDLNI